jgi:hypothetical protein
MIGEITMKIFAKDIIKAAKSDPYFDKSNAKTIASDYNMDEQYIRNEIKFVRSKLNFILAGE